MFINSFRLIKSLPEQTEGIDLYITFYPHNGILNNINVNLVSCIPL